MARRRRVDDDQVVLAALGEHAELLDRHVLVRAREALREVLVEAVLQDPLAHLGEAHGARPARPRRPSDRASARRACRAARGPARRGSRRDLARPRCPSAAQAERVGEAARRIDRDAPPCAGPASAPQSATDAAIGRLADAAAAGADDDAVARDQLGQRHSAPAPRALGAARRRLQRLLEHLADALELGGRTPRRTRTAARPAARSRVPARAARGSSR